ncbi:MAG: gamma-glutamylcyclotransferase [Alphaproteobacteria bacterium]|nr:gamma-glutamylcyclotransferase [Alphaproteobacteria bacterium]
MRAVLERQPELAWVLDLLYTKAQRDESRQQALSAKTGGDLWIFAYGSLMWDPAMHFQEVRRAHALDFERRFILKDVYGGRGTREAPGLMAALDHGTGCHGLAFRVAEADLETETEILWRREMAGDAYIPTFITTIIDGKPVDALTFVANRASDSICREITHQDQISFISTGSGFLGTSLEYLENIVRQFHALGIFDEECSALLAEVRTHRNAGETNMAGSGATTQGLAN